MGINSIRNSPYMTGIPKNQYSTHAEVAALRAAPRGMNLKNATMYVARIYRTGEPAMSAPCAQCRIALKAAGISKVVYTIDKEMTL